MFLDDEGQPFWLSVKRRKVLNKCMYLCRMHRRKTMVVQQSVELALQFVNVVLYLLPNVWSLVQRCDWDGNLVSAQHGLLKTASYIFALAEHRVLLVDAVPATADQCLRHSSLELMVHCKGMPSTQLLSLLAKMLQPL